MEFIYQSWKVIKSLIFKAVSLILILFHIEWNEEEWQSLFQFVKFVIIGLSNTVISYLINIIILVLLRNYHISWDYIVGNIISILLSILWSFYWNNKLVFCNRGDNWRGLLKALLKMYIAYGFTGIILNNLLSWFWIEIFNISKYAAPIINLLISVPLNFVMNKFWAFKE
ncbi:MAG: GtrA family protein [Lachnospiraceae bacterium]